MTQLKIKDAMDAVEEVKKEVAELRREIAELKNSGVKVSSDSEVIDTSKVDALETKLNQHIDLYNNHIRGLHMNK